MVVLIGDVVAVIVSLNVLDEGLEVEVGQLVLHLEHDVFKELVVEFGGASQDLHVASVLRQASVGDNVVLVVSVHDGRLKPLVISVADEALAILEELGAVHLAVGAVVGSEGSVLANSVLHHAAAVVHLRVQDLTAGPLVLCEGSLIDVEDLEPGAHDVVLLQLLSQGLRLVANDVLSADWRIVDRLEGSSHRHF